nr:nucleotide-binding alpha-beta plait domain-containing protein [Tanacetum cinerariifolium]
MGNYRTKEDDVAMISTSIFVTDFPKSFSAKDLFQSCKQYGHVVDTFIPNKRSKADKRFGFFWFINVFSDESKDNGFMAKSNSFAQVVKGGSMSGNMKCDSIPAMVLDDECLFSKDVTNSLMGRVKDFFSLSNIKIALNNEGFNDINIRYMGELWVMLEFASCKSKDLFRSNVGAGSWFSVLQQANYDFTVEGRIVWVEVEEVPGWIPKIMKVSDDDEQSVEDVKGGDTVVHEVGNHGEDSDVDEVSETMFDESSGQKQKQSEDPFGIYPLLDKQRKVNSHGDTSNENVEKQNGDRDQNNNVEEPFNGRNDCSDNMGTNHDDLDLGCSGRFKKSVAPRTGGSILCLMGEVVKVGQTMGDAIGNSGGILCVWDTNEFCKTNCTVSDYFVIVRGVWVKTGANLLIVFVYAPHDLKDKCLLWDYFTRVSNHWDGEVMMMGDFNEVRFKSDRFGSFFNERGRDMFNSFINNACLEEVPLGECAYTWRYKSASKMSKLDRVALGDQSNGMRNMLFKVKFLKSKIREWINVFKNNSNAELIRLKGELQAVDGDIDNGNGSDEVVSKRTDIINLMLHLTRLRLRKRLKRLRLSGPLRETKTQVSFMGC